MWRKYAETAHFVGLAALVALAGCADPTGTPDAAIDGGAASDGAQHTPGACEDGCLVDGVCYPDGVADPTNPCRTCNAAASSIAFSPRDGAACDDGSFCTVGDTCSAGVCTGTARSCDDGIECNGTEICDEDADTCRAGTSTCASAEVCDAIGGACIATCTGCSIDGVCYGDGQVDPLNPCQRCDAGASRSAWTANDGASCDDGNFCTVGEVCGGGTCGGGASRECSDGVTCNGVETCDETTDACLAGTATCSASQICDLASDTCTATCTGCVIGGVCFGAGQLNPDNPCEVCEPPTSTSSFSSNDGARCDDSLFCTTGDVCVGTICAGSATNFCDDGITCNGTETCDESTDRCQAGATTCAGDTVCDAATDSCVLRCAGGTTLCASTCVQTDSDPRNCGGCERVCSAPVGADPVCIAGRCSAVCTDGYADCDGDPTTACAPLATDEQHCGACGNACAEGETCRAGVCTPPHLVFITSETFYPAELGSLATADAHCQRLAEAAGLPGTYKAWLSDSSASASTRFTHANVPYVRVDGVKVADNWSDLTDSSLDAPISVNEAGGEPPESDLPVSCGVVTGTMMNGTLASGPQSCGDWMDASSSFLAGNSTETDANWTRSCQAPCIFAGALYCFQQ